MLEAQNIFRYIYLVIAIFAQRVYLLHRDSIVKCKGECHQIVILIFYVKEQHLHNQITMLCSHLWFVREEPLRSSLFIFEYKLGEI